MTDLDARLRNLVVEMTADEDDALLPRLRPRAAAIEPAALTPETDFIRDLGFDSLDVVELVMAIEDEFGIEIPDAEAESLNTYGDALRIVAALVPQPQEAAR